MSRTGQWMLHTLGIKKSVQKFAKKCLKHFFPEFLCLVLITKYILKCYRSTDYTVVFFVHSQGNRFALEKHVDDNTKQQHQIVSLKSALSRLSLNYTGNKTTSATQQLLQ
jgi:hypothetical protein